MKKKIALLLATGMIVMGLLAGCGSTPSKTSESTNSETVDTEDKKAPKPGELAGLTDGTYSAKFETDSTMFHVNEVYHDLGKLTVKDGYMTIHVVLAGKGYTKLYLGTASEAEASGEANQLIGVEEEVQFEDGTTDTVYAFDIPVDKFDTEFQLACYGTKKDKWYDHAVKVSLVKEEALVDGEYDVELTMEGGSGKASINSPVKVLVKDGKATATLVWSSKNYDYMLVDGIKYENEAEAGSPSVFQIPISALTCDLEVIGDTIAMGTPHEIEYTLHFKMDK